MRLRVHFRESSEKKHGLMGPGAVMVLDQNGHRCANELPAG